VDFFEDSVMWHRPIGTL